MEDFCLKVKPRRHINIGSLNDGEPMLVEHWHNGFSHSGQIGVGGFEVGVVLVVNGVLALGLSGDKRLIHRVSWDRELPVATVGTGHTTD